MRVTVAGAGVCGLACALELAERGLDVDVIDVAARPGVQGCSWWAAGMLAPWCECETAEPVVERLGRYGIDWWQDRFEGTRQTGTLVVAGPRDASELQRFARRTNGHQPVDEGEIAGLEPDLAGRFRSGLLFAQEAHLDPRAALAVLADRLKTHGVAVRYGVDLNDLGHDEADQIVDCRGFAARDALTDLRGVRGEMLVLRSADVQLSRPVRMLHPRFPVYVVPRANGLFMVGATMLESDSAGGPSARSVVELLSAACAVHPAFGEAEIVETGAAVRPAFADNLPAVRRSGRVVSVNGFYRHGFLLAPAMAVRLCNEVAGVSAPTEVSDEYSGQRATA